MKFYAMLACQAIYAFLMIFNVIPAAFSANSTEANIVGIVLIILFPVVIWVIHLSFYKQAKGNKQKEDDVFTIALGSKVKSNISGFAGVVVSRSEHINGCNRYWIQPPVDKDGKLPEGLWTDEAELEVVEEPVLERKNNDRGGMPSSIR